MERREKGQCGICGWPKEYHRNACPLLVAEGPMRQEAQAAWDAGRAAAEAQKSEAEVGGRLLNQHFAEAFRIFSPHHPTSEM